MSHDEKANSGTTTTSGENRNIQTKTEEYSEADDPPWKQHPQVHHHHVSESADLQQQQQEQHAVEASTVAITSENDNPTSAAPPLPQQKSLEAAESIFTIDAPLPPLPLPVAEGEGGPLPLQILPPQQHVSASATDAQLSLGEQVAMRLPGVDVNMNKEGEEPSSDPQQQQYEQPPEILEVVNPSLSVVPNEMPPLSPSQSLKPPFDSGNSSIAVDNARGHAARNNYSMDINNADLKTQGLVPGAREDFSTPGPLPMEGSALSSVSKTTGTLDAPNQAILSPPSSSSPAENSQVAVVVPPAISANPSVSPPTALPTPPAMMMMMTTATTNEQPSSQQQHQLIVEQGMPAPAALSSTVVNLLQPGGSQGLEPEVRTTSVIGEPAPGVSSASSEQLSYPETQSIQFDATSISAARSLEQQPATQTQAQSTQFDVPSTVSTPPLLDANPVVSSHAPVQARSQVDAVKESAMVTATTSQPIVTSQSFGQGTFPGQASGCSTTSTIATAGSVVSLAPDGTASSPPAVEVANNSLQSSSYDQQEAHKERTSSNGMSASVPVIVQAASVPDEDTSEDGIDDYIRSPEVQNAIVERSPGGRYVRLMEKLGSGASKDVYRAYDTQEGIEVAWNVVSLSGVPKTERNRIVNEVRLLERLHHHSIISFHGSWVNRERQEVNFVTEILSSGTLKSFINKVQVIRWKIAKRWAVQILKGLEYLHSQNPPVMHRDLKCENIFINGTSGDLRIGDLGLSTVHRNGHVLSVLGTPEFMAPDMYEEGGTYDEKVDIYAFGMCMLEIFTKEIPYSECSNPAQIYKKVSAGEPPEVLSRLESKHAKEFVKLCLGYKDPVTGKHIRPSSSDLLKHEFLIKRPNDDDEVLVRKPLRYQPTPEEKSTIEVGSTTPSTPRSLRTIGNASGDSSIISESSKHKQQQRREAPASQQQQRHVQEPPNACNQPLLPSLAPVHAQGHPPHQYQQQGYSQQPPPPPQGQGQLPPYQLSPQQQQATQALYKKTYLQQSQAEQEQFQQPSPLLTYKQAPTSIPANAGQAPSQVYEQPSQIPQMQTASYHTAQNYQQPYAVQQQTPWQPIIQQYQQQQAPQQTNQQYQQQQAAVHEGNLSQQQYQQQSHGKISYQQQLSAPAIMQQYPKPQMVPQQYQQQPQATQQQYQQQIPSQQYPMAPPQQQYQQPVQAQQHSPAPPQQHFQQQQASQQQSVFQQQQYQQPSVASPYQQPTSSQLPWSPQQQFQQQQYGHPTQQSGVSADSTSASWMPPSSYHFTQGVPVPSFSDDDSDEFDEMPESETSMRKVKVLMGRGQELEEDEDGLGQAQASMPQPPLYQQQTPQGLHPQQRDETTDRSSDGTASVVSMDQAPEFVPCGEAVFTVPNQRDAVQKVTQHVPQTVLPPVPLNYLVAAAVIENEGPNTRPYADDILKLVVMLPVEGQTQYVQFDFHLIEDDSVKVAKEMVQELGIPQEAVLEISETISGLACAARMKQDTYRIRMQNRRQQQQQQQQIDISSQPQVLSQAPTSSPVPDFMPSQQQQTSFQVPPPQSQVAPYGHQPQQQVVDRAIPAQSVPSGNQPMAVNRLTPPQSFQENQQHYPQVPQYSTHSVGHSSHGGHPSHAPLPSMSPPPPYDIPHAPTVVSGETLQENISAFTAPITQLQVQQPVFQNVSGGAPLSQGYPTVHATAGPVPQQTIMHAPSADAASQVESHPAPRHLPTSSGSADGVKRNGSMSSTNSDHAPVVHQRPLLNGSSSVSAEYESDSEDDEELLEELRKLDEDFQKNLQRAKKVFDNRMDNLQRSQIEREAQHLKTLEKHEKERLEFEKRLAQEEEQQNRRIEQLQREWDKKRETLAMHKKKHGSGETKQKNHQKAPSSNSVPPSFGDSQDLASFFSAQTANQQRSVSNSSTSPSVVDTKAFAPQGGSVDR